MQSNLETSEEFAKDDEEAKRRSKECKSSDPFPDIPPALLNSADIRRYIAKTGMINPFDPSNLKSASYEVKLRGKCIWWDENGEKKTSYINDETEEFKLKPNSIAFVTPEPIFRLPDYIALRFNLRITNVHRGLLLGTGPLVDPGFEGQLLIPLHNLTTNEYTFRGGDGLIWMEFTKLSPHEDWDSNWDKEYSGEYIPFREDKKHWSAEQYLGKALESHSAIRSSIPEAIQSAQNSAEKASQAAQKSADLAEQSVKSLESTRFRATLAGGIAGLVFIAGILTLAITAYMLTQDATSYVRQNAHFITEQAEIIKSLEREVHGLKKRFDDLTVPSSPIPSSSSSIENTKKKDMESDE